MWTFGPRAVSGGPASCVSGPTWSAMTMLNRLHNSVAYDPGFSRFVCGERLASGTFNSTAEYSAGGVTWTAATDQYSSGSANGFEDVCYGASALVARLDNSNIVKSTDGGDHWSKIAITGGPFGFADGILSFANDRFFSGTGASGGGRGYFTYDGTSFVTSGLLPVGAANILQFLYDGVGVYCALTAAAAYWSTTGLLGSWTASTTPNWTGPIRGVLGGGVLMAVGTGTAISPAGTQYGQRSTDGGKTWTRILMDAASSTRKWCDIIYAQGVFIACNISDQHLLVSSDLGLTWTLTGATNDFTSSTGFARMAFDGVSAYVAVKNATSTVGNVGAC